jgi:hypothetical protein
MSDDIQMLKQEIAVLRQQCESLEVSCAVNATALTMLVRLLDYDEFLDVYNLCDLLDTLCLSNPDPDWQERMIALSEMLRSQRQTP